MGDPFASIISECIIPPEVEETLPHAPMIGEPCFFSVTFSLDGQRLTDSPSNPLEKESLRDIPACKGSSSFPPPRLRLDDFAAIIKHFSQNSDRSLARRDILEIAESKGLSFPPPKWWRPGGYKKVP